MSKFFVKVSRIFTTHRIYFVEYLKYLIFHIFSGMGWRGGMGLEGANLHNPIGSRGKKTSET